MVGAVGGDHVLGDADAQLGGELLQAGLPVKPGDDQSETIAGRLPLRRIGQPDDMAGPAVFLLSDDSAWMTGQSLVIDGGYTAQ